MSKINCVSCTAPIPNDYPLCPFCGTKQTKFADYVKPQDRDEHCNHKRYDDNKRYDLVIFIGRFQPPTTAHVETIKHALQYGSKVLILAGSDNQPRTIKNPWTVGERFQMIYDCFPEDKHRILGEGIEDYTYNDQLWARNVQNAVKDYLPIGWTDRPHQTAIIGHSKDESSYYLEMFPQWEPLEMDNIEGINATDVRDLYFNPLWTLHRDGSIFEEQVKDHLPEAIGDYLMDFTTTTEYAQLAEEQTFLSKYKAQFEHAPYPTIHNTTDAVVIQSGHILLIERRANPGKGLWALPGGFLGVDERIVNGMMRELREETRLDTPEKILRGSIVDREVFDHPDRSLRGRTITHAFHIALPNGPLSKVRGTDDAKKAKWIPIADALSMGKLLFEDHIHIIRHFIGEV